MADEFEVDPRRSHRVIIVRDEPYLNSVSIALETVEVSNPLTVMFVDFNLSTG